MNDSNFVRGLKGALVGGLWVGGFSTVVVRCVKSNYGFDDFLTGAIAGALIGFVPAVCLPKGFSLPKDITTLTHQAISAFCFWVVTDGLVKGEIHGIDRRRVFRAFNELVSWEKYPMAFVTYFFVWSVIGAVSLSVPVFYYLKAIHETSPSISSPRIGTVLSVYSKWQELPENFRAVFVFTIALSSILVLLYLVLSLSA